MQLQEKYKERGLEVVGIAADEDAPTAVEARTKLDAWLAEKCPDLNHSDCVRLHTRNEEALEGTRLLRRDSTSFVVDRDGCIAFIAEPTR